MGKYLIISLIIFLFTSNLLSQTIIQPGNVSGIWTSSGSPYLITGDISVPSNDSLKIQEGVEVRLIGNYQIEVLGILKAYGKKANPIIFHSISGIAGSWKSIYFSPTAKPSCILDYCNIADGGGVDSIANIFIINNLQNVTVSNCEITNSSGNGIYIQASLVFSYGNNQLVDCKPIISGNFIHSNTTNGIFVNSYFYNNGAGGGHDNKCFTRPVIQNNVIYENNMHGLQCHTFADGGTNYAFEGNPTIQTNPYIQGNTIYSNNHSGIFCSQVTQGYWYGTIIIEANPLISSNIISNQNDYGLDANNLVTVANVKHNNFWNNGIGPLSGIGGTLCQNTQTNLNNDPCDINLNIQFDPEFVNETMNNFNLTAFSKCIDAGDLNLPLDPDNTIADIGALFYDQRIAIINTSTTSLNFSDIPIGKSETDTVVISNTGDGQLNVLSIAVTGSDSNAFETDTTLFSLSPSETKNLEVVFSPNEIRGYSASLDIQSNGGNVSVNLSGNGIQGNRPPYVSYLIPDTSFAEDSGPVMLTSDLNTFFTDPDPGDTLSFDATSSTPGIQVTVQNRSLMLNSTSNFFGSGNVIVTATDIEGLSVKDTFNVQVTPVNDPPIVGQLLLPADNDTLISLDGPIIFVWSKATDADNDTLLYLLHIFDNALDTLITNSNDTTNTITETKFLKSATTYQWNVLVTDKSDTVLTNSFSFITPLINGIAGSNGSLPKTYSLSQNFPNPFNPTTKIAYSLPKAGKVSLKVFDMLGREVTTLVNEEKTAGNYEVTFDATVLPSGVYFYTLISGKNIQSRKMILLK